MSSWTSWFTSARPTRASVTTIAPAQLPGRASGKFQPLHVYLANRYATMAVLTFSEIEDLLGFALPAAARTDGAWWTAADPGTPGGAYAQAWTSAGRTAVPNLLARNVRFERGA